MRFFDVRSPIFVPLWRRVLVFGLVLAWALLELWRGAPGWALLFGVAALWIGWQFFFDFRLPEDDTDGDR
jgi:hypothetical protein